jgi:hypothetical protein
MTANGYSWTEFQTREALAGALAGAVAEKLAAAIDRRGGGLLAVSGGTTPGRFFEALSTRAFRAAFLATLQRHAGGRQTAAQRCIRRTLRAALSGGGECR